MTTTLQLTLDHALAEVALSDSLQRVDDHADPSWRDVAYQCVIDVAGRLSEFTTDAVLSELALYPTVSTHEPRALGPVMMRASRDNVISATSRFVKSEAVSRHRAPKQVWRSNIYRERCTKEISAARAA